MGWEGLARRLVTRAGSNHRLLVVGIADVVNLCRSPPIGEFRECVVELVGLEPTTKVLWNMVGVRPTPLIGHLSRSLRFVVLRDYPGFRMKAAF